MTTSASGKDELREKISRAMGWWSPDGFDAYPEKTDKIMQLIATSNQQTVQKTFDQIFEMAPKKNFEHWTNKMIADWFVALGRLERLAATQPQKDERGADE